jgi:(1->4)-alpha-D-glucan 1-alpha-D-glucosylmutase
VLDLARACRTDPGLTAAIEAALSEHAAATTATTLAAKVLQLTIPGVPDIYQGCEWLALTLVDPDNRRPVDYPDLRSRFVGLDQAGGLGAGADVSEAKVWVTSRVLRLRRERPELFGADSSYRPLESSSHLVGFVREHTDGAVATVVPRVSWTREAPSITLPDGRWTDVLSGSVHEGGPRQQSELHGHLPVAVLLRESG